MKRPKAVSVERRVAAGVGVAVVVAAALATAIFARLTDTRTDEVARIESVADSLSKTLAGGAPPQPLLTVIVDTGVAGGAVLYDATGSPLARAGLAGGDAGEVVCRTVILAGGNGSLCVEPAVAMGTARGKRITDAVLAVAAATLIVAMAAATLTAWMTRKRLRGVRRSVERAAGDASFAQRIEPAGGELAPLVLSVNNLLDQAQSRESELRRRTHDLEVANKDLESFAHTVSHDLRGPLGSVLGFAEAMRDGYGGELNADGQEYTHWIVDSAHQMRSLIDGLLHMTRLSRAEMQRDVVDLSAIVHSIATSLQKSAPERSVTFTIADNVVANGDERLLRAVLENLIANAWKFTGKRDGATIEFGMTQGNGHSTFYVRDNGAGFDPTHAAKMFRPFQRLHSASEFEGTGIGLATVQRILQRHGGKAWAEGEPEKGATVYFTTGAALGTGRELQESP
jgi:signal transduction histidine kinase